jgi:hypothetical protein
VCSHVRCVCHHPLCLSVLRPQRPRHNSSSGLKNCVRWVVHTHGAAVQGRSRQRQHTCQTVGACHAHRRARVTDVKGGKRAHTHTITYPGWIPQVGLPVPPNMAALSGLVGGFTPKGNPHAWERSPPPRHQHTHHTTVPPSYMDTLNTLQPTAAPPPPAPAGACLLAHTSYVAVVRV